MENNSLLKCHNQLCNHRQEYIIKQWIRKVLQIWTTINKKQNITQKITLGDKPLKQIKKPIEAVNK